MSYPIQTQGQIKLYIKALRLKAGYTQAQVGHMLGLTQQGYQRLESKPESISVLRFLELLQVLHATLSISERRPANNPHNVETEAELEIYADDKTQLLAHQGLGSDSQKTIKRKKIKHTIKLSEK
jgi:HTH-type transcriptional regulator / antitoxin HipB